MLLLLTLLVRELHKARPVTRNARKRAGGKHGKSNAHIDEQRNDEKRFRSQQQDRAWNPHTFTN